MSTDVNQFIADLDAGTLEQKLSVILSQVAGGVLNHNKAGKVTLTLDISKITNSHQVLIKHKLAYAKPTARGKATEEDTTSTPMHVGTGGKLTFFPENQTQMFTKQGDIKITQQS